MNISHRRTFLKSAASEQLTLSFYCEYQAEGYGDTNMPVRLNSRPDIFSKGMPAA